MKKRGFALLGVVVALAILAVMAKGIAVLVANNDNSRMKEQYSVQSYYLGEAAFQYALNEVTIQGASSIPNLDFIGTSLGLSTSGGKIYSSVNYDGALRAFSITKPNTLGPACIYVLASSGSGAVNLSGSTSLGSSTCGMYVNSSSSTAVELQGSATINSYFLNLVGNYNLLGGTSITTNKGTVTAYNGATGIVTTGATAVSDPLASYNMPTYSSCNYTNESLQSGTTTINPGVYCNGLQIGNTAVVHMNAGNYIVDGGYFSVAGSATLTGSGVTVFLNKQLETTWPTVSFSNGATVTLTAPTTGTYAGIAIFQSRSATSATNSILGGGAVNITGAIYLPNQALDFYGGSSSSTPCTMIVANTLTLGGAAYINCSAGSLSGLIN